MKNYSLKLRRLDVIKIAVMTLKILTKKKEVVHLTLGIGNQLGYNKMLLRNLTVNEHTFIRIYFFFYL